MTPLSIIAAGVLRLAFGAQLDAGATDGAADAVRSALEVHDYRRAESLLEEVPAGERPLLAARVRFEVGDFVGCTRVAADALATATADQRRELTWWGAKAALWLQDAAGAEAWTAQLTQSSAGDAAWESVARDYAALAAELSRGADDERRALATSRWTVAVGVVLVAGLSLTMAMRSTPS